MFYPAEKPPAMPMNPVFAMRVHDRSSTALIDGSF
jgi:hypothetical protein